jgi:hypothetical protein
MFESARSALRPYFIDGLKFWHRLYSLRFAILSAILGMWTQVQPYIGDMFSARWAGWLSIFFAILSAVSTIIKQPNLLKELEEDNA